MGIRNKTTKINNICININLFPQTINEKYLINDINPKSPFDKNNSPLSKGEPEEILIPYFLKQVIKKI